MYLVNNNQAWPNYFTDTAVWWHCHKESPEISSAPFSEQVFGLRQRSVSISYSCPPALLIFMLKNPCDVRWHYKLGGKALVVEAGCISVWLIWRKIDTVMCWPLICLTADSVASSAVGVKVISSPQHFVCTHYTLLAPGGLSHILPQLIVCLCF